MLEALWSVEFMAVGMGRGVAVLETGRILGGDAQYFYVGDYSVHDGVATAKVTVTHYAGQPVTVFGPAKSITLELSGAPAHGQFDMHGHIAGNPAAKIGIRLTRRAELP